MITCIQMNHLKTLHSIYSNKLHRMALFGSKAYFSNVLQKLRNDDILKKFLDISIVISADPIVATKRLKITLKLKK